MGMSGPCGGKVSKTNKEHVVISLGAKSNRRHQTNSSWSIADQGNGLNQFESLPVYHVTEKALYLLWNKRFTPSLSSSLGLRHDRSSEFGSINNPRAALIYKPLAEKLAFKFLYGSAFRQPSVFELHSTFRGNLDLKPEKIV